jgi:hypothetical protein
MAIVGSSDSSQIVVSRPGIVATIKRSEDSSWYPHRAIVPPGYGSDIQHLSSTSFGGEPCLLLGLGPWSHYSLYLMKPSAKGGLVSVASVVLGNPSGAFIARPPGRKEDVVLALLKSEESYVHRERFGSASPHGWDCGVHVLRVDTASRSLVPVCGLRLPRPRRSDTSLQIAGVLGDAAPEILIATHDSRPSNVYGSTRIARWTERGMSLEDTGLRLPGMVTAVLPHSTGGVDLLVRWSPAEIRVVTIGLD